MPPCGNFFAQCNYSNGTSLKLYREDILQLLHDDRCETISYRVINHYCGFTLNIVIPYGETSSLGSERFYEIKHRHFLHTTFQSKVGLASCCANQTPECLE